jgi:hypothetical protein
MAARPAISEMRTGASETSSSPAAAIPDLIRQSKRHDLAVPYSERQPPSREPVPYGDGADHTDDYSCDHVTWMMRQEHQPAGRDRGRAARARD